MECGHVIVYTFGTRDDGYALPIPYKHQVLLLPSHLQVILFVPKEMYELITSNRTSTSIGLPKKIVLYLILKCIILITLINVSYFK